MKWTLVIAGSSTHIPYPTVKECMRSLSLYSDNISLLDFFGTLFVFAGEKMLGYLTPTASLN